MFGLVTNLAKAAVAVVATPVAVVVDVLTLPSAAWDNRDAFSHTADTLEQAKEAFDAAVKPD